jgi:hypothetical protein
VYSSPTQVESLRSDVAIAMQHRVSAPSSHQQQQQGASGGANPSAVAIAAAAAVDSLQVTMQAAAGKSEREIDGLRRAVQRDIGDATRAIGRLDAALRAQQTQLDVLQVRGWG